MRKFLRKVKQFAINVIVKVKNNTIKFIKDVWHHAEAATILVFASLGLTGALSELPFVLMLPMWIEATMVIPVISVIGICLLLKSSEWRAKRRLTLAA